MPKPKSDRERLIEDAKDAIIDLFSDTSVSKEQTISDLEDLIGEIEMKIDSLKSL